MMLHRKFTLLIIEAVAGCHCPVRRNLRSKYFENSSSGVYKYIKCKSKSEEHVLCLKKSKFMER